jgi:hypothetical protein
MPIAQSTLRNASYSTLRRGSLHEARANNRPTAFLSHSHKDALLAKGLQVFLNKEGWDVYIDWEDTAMPDKANRQTADRIKQKITQLDLFLFLATYHSMTSRWCPWELGYADGEKQNDDILLIQTRDDQGSTYGSEYLDLYRRIDYATGGGIGAFHATGQGHLLKGFMRP